MSVGVPIGSVSDYLNQGGSSPFGGLPVATSLPTPGDIIAGVKNAGTPVGGATLGVRAAGDAVGAIFGFPFAGETLSKFVAPIAGLFAGVPHNAKTLGTGEQMMTCRDPILQYLGAQIVIGAKQERVFSESGTDCLFESQISALAGALFALANRYPVDCVSARKPNGDTTLGPFYAPKGAPYTGQTQFDVFTQMPVAESRYAARHGFSPPSETEMVAFLTAVGPNIETFACGDDHTTYVNAQRAVFNAYKKYVRTHGGGTLSGIMLLGAAALGAFALGVV